MGKFVLLCTAVSVMYLCFIYTLCMPSPVKKYIQIVHRLIFFFKNKEIKS